MNKNNSGSKGNPLTNSLIAPILIALVAGGTSPWWVSLFRDDETVNSTISVDQNSKDIPQSTRGIEGDTLSKESSPNTNVDNSQQEENKAIVSGTGNSVIQGTGNQLTIQKESDARSRGEFEIPAVSGMSYHGARETLLKEGWVPSTQRHFYPGEEPSLQYGSGKVFWELGYWEVVSCSGIAEGFCRFEFSDPSGRRLVVITAGMEEPSIPVQAQVNRVFLTEGNLP